MWQEKIRSSVTKIPNLRRRARQPLDSSAAGAILSQLLQGAAHEVDALLGMVRVNHFENHIVAGLELAHHGIELVFGACGLLVHARNHQARLQPLQIRERARAHRIDEHAGGMYSGGHLRRDFVHHEPQLGLAGAASAFRIGFGLRVVHVGKYLVAIADGHRGILLLAVAYVTQADRRSRPAAGDFVHQVVAVLDGASVDAW